MRKIVKKRYIFISIVAILLVGSTFYAINTNSGEKEIKFNCIITDSKCQKNFAYRYSQNHTPEESLAMLYKLDYQKKIGYCHDIVHEAGRQAFKLYKNDKNMLKIILPGELTFICSGGYFHGLLQEAGTEKNMDFINRAGRSLCTYGESSLDKDYRTEGCMHAIGHGYYLAGLPIDKTVESCRDLSFYYKKEDNYERKYFEFKCINGYAMEYIFHVNKSNPPLTSSQQIIDICSITTDQICGAAFVRDVLENNVLTKEQYIPRGKDLHQYCSNKKYFSGDPQIMCEYNIGFAVVSLFADNPPPEVLAQTLNDICYTDYCQKGGYGVNQVHGFLNTKEYSKKFCERLKYIVYKECFIDMTETANKIEPNVKSQIDKVFRDPAVFIKK